MKHRLNLYENALDSLNEGLRRFIEGHGGEDRAYKFAVLHFAHFFELLLKYGVAQEHELLIYKKPHATNLKGGQTVGLWESLRILKHAGHSFEKNLSADLEWLKSLRNEIEHFQFEMDVVQVRSSLGRILRAAEEVSQILGLDSLREGIHPDCHSVLNQLLDEYRDRLANAQVDAENDLDAESVDDCPLCGEENVSAAREGEHYCFFCKEAEDVLECSICGDSFRESDCVIWNDDHLGERDYACVYCQNRVFNGR